MNVIKHRTYKLELDVWEPIQKEAEKELDKLFKEVGTTLTHCGKVRLRLESEDIV